MEQRDGGCGPPLLHAQKQGGELVVGLREHMEGPLCSVTLVEQGTAVPAGSGHVEGGREAFCRALLLRKRIKTTLCESWLWEGVPLGNSFDFPL